MRAAEGALGRSLHAEVSLSRRSRSRPRWLGDVRIKASALCAGAFDAVSELGYTDGGSETLVKALAASIERQGGRLHLGTPVRVRSRPKAVR